MRDRKRMFYFETEKWSRLLMLFSSRHVEAKRKIKSMEEIFLICFQSMVTTQAKIRVTVKQYDLMQHEIGSGTNPLDILWFHYFLRIDAVPHFIACFTLTANVCVSPTFYVILRAHFFHRFQVFLQLDYQVVFDLKSDK